MTDKDFWLIIRRALMMICKAIERKYTGSKEVELDTNEQTTVSYLVED